MKTIKVYCSFGWTFDFEHEKQIELFVDMYQCQLASNDAVKVLLLIESSAIIKNIIESAIQNHHLFDYILTFDEDVLKSCKNAYLFEYGTTFLKDPFEFTEKKFSVSTVVGGKNETTGHLMRHKLWERQEQIKIPKDFFLSGTFPGEIKHARNTQTLGVEKNILFDSQFHIAIENIKRDYYFTEKLIDCLKTKTIPIYYGSKEIGNYFNKEGMYIVNSVDEIIDVCNNLTENTYNEKIKFIEENFEKSKRFWDYKEAIKNKLKELIK